jgi:hypothetical protein
MAAVVTGLMRSSASHAPYGELRDRYALTAQPPGAARKCRKRTAIASWAGASSLKASALTAPGAP